VDAAAHRRHAARLGTRTQVSVCTVRTVAGRGRPGTDGVLRRKSPPKNAALPKQPAGPVYSPYAKAEFMLVNTSGSYYPDTADGPSRSVLTITGGPSLLKSRPAGRVDSHLSSRHDKRLGRLPHFAGGNPPCHLRCGLPCSRRSSSGKDSARCVVSSWVGCMDGTEDRSKGCSRACCLPRCLRRSLVRSRLCCLPCSSARSLSCCRASNADSRRARCRSSSMTRSSPRSLYRSLSRCLSRSWSGSWACAGLPANHPYVVVCWSPNTILPPTHRPTDCLGGSVRRHGARFA
jgi:hypothetical protein